MNSIFETHLLSCTICIKTHFVLSYVKVHTKLVCTRSVLQNLFFFPMLSCIQGMTVTCNFLVPFCLSTYSMRTHSSSKQLLNLCFCFLTSIFALYFTRQFFYHIKTMYKNIATFEFLVKFSYFYYNYIQFSSDRFSSLQFSSICFYLA